MWRFLASITSHNLPVASKSHQEPSKTDIITLGKSPILSRPGFPYLFFFCMRSSALKCCSAQTFLFHENSLNCKLSHCGVLIWETIYAGDVDLCCESRARAVSLPQDLDDESFLFYLRIPANHQIVCSCIHYCINNNIV